MAHTISAQEENEILPATTEAAAGSRFHTFWNCLMATGIDESVNPGELKYIRFTNVAIVLSAIAVAAYIPVSLLHHQFLLSGLQCIDVIMVLAALWLNHHKMHTAARHFYLVVINSFVLINAYFIGYQSHVHDFFYISYVVPFLLFSVRDYKNILVGVLMAITFFNIHEHAYGYFSQFNPDSATQAGVYQVNLWMKFVLFGLAIYMMAYYNYKSENELMVLNEKLEKQTAELKRSNEDLEQFAYIISHDLKTPVRNISSFIQLILTRNKAEISHEVTEFMNLAKTSADRLFRQIEDLLCYCKTGRNLPVASDVDLNKLVSTIKADLKEKINEKNTLVIIENRLPVLTGVHQSMMHHIFQNLIANAVKFNTNNNPVVALGSKVEEGFLVCWVQDNGIGINPTYKDKLFQMFKRLHTPEQFEGTGIGLAVCKKIVSFYNGNIWFESKPGEGATFFFSLPVQYLAIAGAAPKFIMAEQATAVAA